MTKPINPNIIIPASFAGNGQKTDKNLLTWVYKRHTMIQGLALLHIEC